MMTHDEMIAVIAGQRDGKVIERRRRGLTERWEQATDCFGFNFTYFDYRVRSEPPKPREFWINSYSSTNLCCRESREEADKHASRDRIECIHVREVLE